MTKGEAIAVQTLLRAVIEHDVVASDDVETAAFELAARSARTLQKFGVDDTVNPQTVDARWPRLYPGRDAAHFSQRRHQLRVDDAGVAHCGACDGTEFEHVESVTSTREMVSNRDFGLDFGEEKIGGDGDSGDGEPGVVCAVPACASVAILPDPDKGLGFAVEFH
jgi:hypothetical protein